MTATEYLTGRSWSGLKSARHRVRNGIVRTVQWRTRNVIEVGAG